MHAPTLTDRAKKTQQNGQSERGHGITMPAPCTSLAGRQKEWRQAGRTTLPSPSILSEEDRKKAESLARRERGTGPDVKSNSENKQTAHSLAMASATQSRNNRRDWNSTESPTLKVDERLRLARERREEHLKQLASRERGWLAREEKARRYYEKHLEERRKKLEDQRQREERRRRAVEEKRRQKLREERERFETALRRTMERSNKARPSLGHCSQRGLSNTRSNVNAKRRSLSQWEIDLVSRLQTPTISYLARSRSAVCLAQGEASCHSMSSSSPPKSQQSRGPTPHRGAVKPGLNNGIQRTSNKELGSNGYLEKKEWKKAQSHANKNSSAGPSIRPSIRQPSPRQECLPSLKEEEDLVSERVQSSTHPQYNQSAPPCLVLDGGQEDSGLRKPAFNRPPFKLDGPQTPVESSLTKGGSQCRPSAGTTDPEEASRLLAEKRRQARLQREKEEEECKQREEVERRGREEFARRRAEERARQEAEAQRLEEEKRRQEEEQKMAEEENARKQSEEDKQLQKQREEEEAQQRLVAEQQRMERESRFQKEEAERQERKKRLDEIMKRTRNTDTNEKKPASPTIIMKQALPNENLKPIHSLPLEEVIKLPDPAMPSKIGMDSEEDILPAVAFKERRSLRPLTGLEEIQAHQRAEVI